jgi:hypothetical protein
MEVIQGATRRGQSARLSLTTGTYNTAVGSLSLRRDTTGSYNTTIGAGGLFNNATENDNTATGFIALLNNTLAEDVAEVNPDLVVHDKEGKPYSVRYDQVNAMLLNEFLKEHGKIEEQGEAIAQLKKEVASLAATVKEQSAQIQNVSARVELRGPAGAVVSN